MCQWDFKCLVLVGTTLVLVPFFILAFDQASCDMNVSSCRQVFTQKKWFNPNSIQP
ncbi:hypothetical protein HanPSC8_Chr17g0753831 [Helianthus annuus]|nr:hypothetical protein HanPSC8_Chr17g0753831 [Helianthus annuus]